MAFEKFTQHGKSYTPKVSIWSRGQFGFSNGATNRFKLRNFDYVVFFYDGETKRIGLKFTNEEETEGACKLSKRKTGIMVGAKSFLDFYNIIYEKTTQYDLEFNEEEQLFILDLNKPTSE